MDTPYLSYRPDIVHFAVASVIRQMFPTVGEFCLFQAERGNQATAWVRQIGMFVMVERLGAGQMITARFFIRDRTTVLHACRLVEQMIAENGAARDLVDLVESHTRTRLNQIVEEEATTGTLPEIGAPTHG